MRSVLILGAYDDPQALRVAQCLRASQAAPIWCDTAAFPEKDRLSAGNSGWRLNDEPVPPVGAVYLRGFECNPSASRYAEDFESRPRGLLAQMDEKRSMLSSFVLTLEGEGAVVVNGLMANAQHTNKPYQLALLRRAGLPVPDWLATNDPEEVRSFVKAVGMAVYKPLSGGATVRKVDPEDLTDKRLAALQAAPVLFQELAEGVSIRAYVVGRRVVAAAAIRSSELDYRRGEETVELIRLAPEERRAAVGAARACGMLFTGVDLIRTAKGHKVLECNPSPMFAVFEEKTGLDVAGPLANLLLRLAR